MLRRLTISCAALALGLSACGGDAGSGAGGDADPASFVPANAPIYVEAVVRPEGEQREEALAAAGKILGEADPAGKLKEWFDEGLSDEDLTYDRDFAPWLGERAGLWGGADAAETEEFAGVIAVRDEEAAEAALPRLQGEGATKGQHGDVDYLLDTDGNAAAVVDGFLVVGVEAAVKRTLDARDGDVLADADRYTGVVDELEDERLGHYYVDTKTLLDAAMAADPQAGAQLDQLRGFLPVDKLGPLAGSFSADGEALAFDQVVTDVPEGPLRELTTLFAGESELLGELPGDAWAALAVNDLGSGAEDLFNSVAGAIGGVAIAGQVREQTGLDLQADVFSWMGDVGFFVRGTDMASLDGALVIESTDDGKAEAAFGKLAGLAGAQTGGAPEPVRIEGADQAFGLSDPGLPQTVIMARGEGKVVLALGEAAAAAALSPAAELADAPAFDAATEALGDTPPMFVLSMPAVIRLVDAMGAADAEFDSARPYLEALDTIAAGGSADDGTVRSSSVVTLK